MPEPVIHQPLHYHFLMLVELVHLLLQPSVLVLLLLLLLELALLLM